MSEHSLGMAPETAKPLATPLNRTVLQRRCDCGSHTISGGECTSCRQERLQRAAVGRSPVNAVPPIVHEVLRSPGRPLDAATRDFMEPRFGYDFSKVRIHSDESAAKSARAVNALAYTVGSHVVFGPGRHEPGTGEGRRLMAHELAHVVQQGSAHPAGADLGETSDSFSEERNADMIADSALSGVPIGPITTAAPVLRRRAEPYIKKITVHLTPPQTAELEWRGTPPEEPGSDRFTVSTGKGYGDPGDPPGTCTRSCCRDPLTQCAPPWNQPTRVGACCTYYGNSFWTGTPLEEHNGWKWWTPIQPYYSSRGIALHQHTTVTGEPIGHGCVRMSESDAKRIHDFSNGRRTNVTIDGRAAPVACDADRSCSTSGTPSSGATGMSTESDLGDRQMALGDQRPVAGLEGVMS